MEKEEHVYCSVSAEPMVHFGWCLQLPAQVKKSRGFGSPFDKNRRSVQRMNAPLRPGGIRLKPGRKGRAQTTTKYIRSKIFELDPPDETLTIRSVAVSENTEH